MGGALSFGLTDAFYKSQQAIIDQVNAASKDVVNRAYAATVSEAETMDAKLRGIMQGDFMALSRNAQARMVQTNREVVKIGTKFDVANTGLFTEVGRINDKLSDLSVDMVYTIDDAARKIVDETAAATEGITSKLLEEYEKARAASADAMWGAATQAWEGQLGEFGQEWQGVQQGFVTELKETIETQSGITAQSLVDQLTQVAEQQGQELAAKWESAQADQFSFLNDSFAKSAFEQAQLGEYVDTGMQAIQTAQAATQGIVQGTMGLVMGQVQQAQDFTQQLGFQIIDRLDAVVNSALKTLPLLIVGMGVVVLLKKNGRAYM